MAGRRLGRRHRRGLRAAAGAERHRQLDQGGAARAGAHRARPEGAGRASAAGRPVDAGARWTWRRSGKAAGRRAAQQPVAPSSTPRRCRPSVARRPPTAAVRRASSPPSGAAHRGRTSAPTVTRRRAAPMAGADSSRCRAAQRVLGTVALSLATFMNVLDTSIANVSDPGHRRQPGRQPDQGTWVITSFARRQCHLGAADRLADAALRRGAAVRRQRRCCSSLASLLCGLRRRWSR